ncbi:Trypanosomal VSG domain containing protein [Trypanosoma brucei equiperdum]|uniref:Trypanosomal VSG domain containing protein n=1 Tax=Trypanosoma brucei equiperdum TaxID=630700 RepID=A0A3L6L5J7_9TRYP|nr:Trypanosomal VSG domain containing protein [Trypanosoma brucei equiperdum]
MWRVVMQVVMVGMSVTRVTAADNNGIGHGNERKGFDLMCGLFAKAEKGAKGENYIDKLKDDSDYQWFNKDARDLPALKTEVDKVKELESKVQSYESGARTAFRKAAYGDNIETEDADKTFGSHGEHSPCDPTNRSSTIPKEIVCFCSSVGATDYCFVGVKAQNHDGSTAEQRSQAWNDLKSRCTGGSGSVEVTVDAIRKDLEGLRGLYPQEPIDDPPQPPPPPPQKKRDPLASKPWVQRLNEATDHMNKRDAALGKLKEQVKKLKETYGKAKNEEEVKALKESGAGAEGAQPSRTAPQTAARKDSDAEPTQTQKQNIASFPSLKITLLSVSLCFI